MKPHYPYEFEAHELDDWARVWGRWRNNANILMLLGINRRTAEDISATWPMHSDDLLHTLDIRAIHYDDHGVVVFD